MTNYSRLLAVYRAGRYWSHSEIWSQSMEGYLDFYMGSMFGRLEGKYKNFWLGRAHKNGNQNVQNWLKQLTGASHATLQNVAS